MAVYRYSISTTIGGFQQGEWMVTIVGRIKIVGIVTAELTAK
jgi:hypothetical protein